MAVTLLVEGRILARGFFFVDIQVFLQLIDSFSSASDFVLYLVGFVLADVPVQLKELVAVILRRGFEHLQIPFYRLQR